MKLKATIPVLLAGLAIAPSASASTHHLSGAFRADPTATVSMDVVVRHDRPVIARNIHFNGLDYACEGSGATGEIAADLGRASVFESARGGYEFETEPSVPGIDAMVAGGLLGRSAAKVKGGIVYAFEDASGDLCQSAFDGRYVVR